MTDGNGMVRRVTLRCAVAFASLLAPTTAAGQAPGVDALFPPALTRFAPFAGNPVFTAAGPGTWEVRIRERGFILKEADGYHLWYTGYDGDRAGVKRLGYATSDDGVNWKRYPANPIDRRNWVEDVYVVPHDDGTGLYSMFAEGVNDEAHRLTSHDKIHWTRVGKLDVRLKDGTPIPAGPYGTPTAIRANERWNLFYERRDAGVWLATSEDMAVWTNVRDEPVLTPGPAPYEKLMIAMNQVIRHGDRYYALYHGKGDGPDWCSCLATSADMVNWVKYPANPLLAGNQSSPQYVPHSDGYRLYSTHDQVRLHEPLR